MLCFVNLVQSYGVWKNCPSKTINKGKCFYKQYYQKKYYTDEFVLANQILIGINLWNVCEQRWTLYEKEGWQRVCCQPSWLYKILFT